MEQNPEDSPWRRKYAFYAASLLRQGNFVDAGFVSAVLFEKIVENELLLNGLEKPDGPEFLANAIEQLSRKDPLKYNSAYLHTLRKIRERHITHACETVDTGLSHTEREIIKAEIARLVTYVWQTLDLESYIRYRTIGTIPLDDADNAVSEIRECMNDEEADIAGMPGRFEERDFNDLRHLRLHMVNLSAYLKKHFLPSYRNLAVEVIGKADHTSAYVWMVINLIRPWPVQLKGHLHYASTAIMATPLELRIYINLGSEAYMSRADWYSFLETDLFREFVIRLPDMQIFDAEWYSFITDIQPVSSLLGSESLQQRIEAARGLLAEYMEPRKTISWGRLMAGFVFKRSEISYEDVGKKLNKIVRLYYLFEKYRRDVLKRKNTLDWVPRGV
jgi:hypothetical protein